MTGGRFAPRRMRPACEGGRLGSAWGRRASYAEAAVRAVALALRDHSRVAARWTEAGLVPARSTDVCVAVALEEGLVVPVVRAADTKSLEALSREIADLAGRARAARLQAAETEGGVFSVTNLGASRVDAFTPLLNWRRRRSSVSGRPGRDRRWSRAQSFRGRSSSSA